MLFRSALSEVGDQSMVRGPLLIRSQPRQPAAVELLGAKSSIELAHVLVFAGADECAVARAIGHGPTKTAWHI